MDDHETVGTKVPRWLFLISIHLSIFITDTVKSTNNIQNLDNLN